MFCYVTNRHIQLLLKRFYALGLETMLAGNLHYLFYVGRRMSLEGGWNEDIKQCAVNDAILS